MTTTEPTLTKHWHAQSAEQVCADLETDPARGLTPDEATQRLNRYGPNRLASIPPRPAWLKFLDQFRNVLVMVLLGAVVLAAPSPSLYAQLVKTGTIEMCGFDHVFVEEDDVFAASRRALQAAQSLPPI